MYQSIAFRGRSVVSLDAPRPKRSFFESAAGRPTTFLCICVLALFAGNAQAQTLPTTDKPNGDREQRLAAYLNGCKFVGQFTIDGKEDKDPKTEEYTISKCEKLTDADMYRLTARIKYGDVDQEVPLDLKILWSGNTPVITMDNFWIPGMGTFGARVLIHSDRYAGTWQHDAVGGHMFGKIVKDKK